MPRSLCSTQVVFSAMSDHSQSKHFSPCETFCFHPLHCPKTLPWTHVSNNGASPGTEWYRTPSSLPVLVIQKNWALDLQNTAPAGTCKESMMHLRQNVWTSEKYLQIIIKHASGFQNKEQKESLTGGIWRQVSGLDFPGCLIFWFCLGVNCLLLVPGPWIFKIFY